MARKTPTVMKDDLIDIVHAASHKPPCATSGRAWSRPSSVVGPGHPHRCRVVLPGSGALLSPLFAAAAMDLSSVSVIRYAWHLLLARL